MNAKKHFIFWSAVFAGFIGFIFIFKSILMPFVLGIAIAYLLNPLVNYMCDGQKRRGLSALIILSTFFLIVIAFITAIAPVLYNELIDFTNALPDYIDKIWALIEPFSRQIQNMLGLETTEDLKSMLSSQADTGLNIAKKFAGGLAAGGQALLGTMTIIVITPIVAYFMMKEWVRVSKWVESLMPRDHKATIMRLLGDIDVKISGFVRGQISVAAFLGVAYAIALSIAGLKYGALIGFSAGLLSIIPMVGSTTGLLTSVVVAWVQSGDLGYVAMIAAIFVGGQLIEGNILTPKIVGDSVGLHPLWIFFALMAGGALFGVLGMLIAVPVAATIGVLSAFAIQEYKDSEFYKSSKKPAKKRAK